MKLFNFVRTIRNYTVSSWCTLLVSSKHPDFDVSLYGNTR